MHGKYFVVNYSTWYRIQSSGYTKRCSYVDAALMMYFIGFWNLMTQEWGPIGGIFFLEKVYGGLVLPYWIRKATTAKEHCRYTETEHMTRRCGQHGDYNTKLYVFHARLQQHCNATCCCTARKCTGKCHNANPLTFHSPTHFSLSLCIQDYMLLQYRPWTRKAKHFFARPLLFN